MRHGGLCWSDAFHRSGCPGPTNQIAEVYLVQHAVQVAVPSPVWSLSQLDAHGFDVAYSGLDRPPPLRFLATEPTMEHERP